MTHKDQLISVFTKIAAGNVTREAGALFLKGLVSGKEKDLVLKELAGLIMKPPPNIYPKTMLHTVMLAKSSAFTPMFVDLLDHGDAKVAVFAAKGLSGMGSDAARRALAKHLDDENYHVRKAAAETLVTGFGKEGVEVLKKHVLACTRGYYFKLTSAEALEKAGAEGLKALAELKLSKDHQVSRAASAAITKENAG